MLTALGNAMLSGPCIGYAFNMNRFVSRIGCLLSNLILKNYSMILETFTLGHYL